MNVRSAAKKYAQKAEMPEEESISRLFPCHRECRKETVLNNQINKNRNYYCYVTLSRNRE